MTLVSHRDLQLSDSVVIEHRLDGGLFNWRRLQAKTKTFSALNFALQNADDAAFPSRTADGLRRSLDVISKTSLRAGYFANTTKTDFLGAPSPDALTIFICGKQLWNSDNLTYFSSNLSFNGDQTDEIHRRINLASSAFGRKRENVFADRCLTILSMITVYNAVVIYTISYGCETSFPYHRHSRLLASFKIRHFQLILELRWWSKAIHSEIWLWAGMPSIESMLLYRQLRWRAV